MNGVVDGVEEDDLRQGQADARFSGSPLSPSFWCSWRWMCMLFVPRLFMKVVPFKVLEAVAHGTVSSMVGSDRTVGR